MTPLITLVTIVVYLLLLFVVERRSSRANNGSFFAASRQTPSWVVALAMVGAPITGITFISVPGMVGDSSFAYLQMVLGFIVGSVAIAYLLIPLYYKHNVTSLYEYLNLRFGIASHKSGAWLFLVSKLLNVALKTFVASVVVQQLLCRSLGVPFLATVVIFMLLVWFYTYRGGVRSVVWIDAVKTLCMTVCVILAIHFVLSGLDLSLFEAIQSGYDQRLTKVFFTEEWNDSRHFVKMFLAGVFMIIAMTGLDQDMMQRTLSSRTQHSAQRNVVFASVLQAVIISLLLVLGALFYLYLADVGTSVEKADEVFASVATAENMPIVISILLVLGVMAATFSATAGALTSLTTSLVVDIMQGKERATSHRWIHATMTVATTLLVLAFYIFSNESTINLVYSVGSYTYGPLLGLFAFGIFSKRKVCDRLVPVVVAIAPAICVLLDHRSEAWFEGYKFGFELLLVNAALTIVGLLLISRRR